MVDENGVVEIGKVVKSCSATPATDSAIRHINGTTSVECVGVGMVTVRLDTFHFVDSRRSEQKWKDDLRAAFERCIESLEAAARL